MKRSEFLENIIEVVEIENEVTESTVLADIKEWDSLAAVTTLALFNKKLGLKIPASELAKCTTVADLLDLGNSQYA
ncbi:MAG: hypothetical protein A3B66_04495 [Alphaproteobacteria bacterium RIFCSPHIGHO2_02_FULL_46_13]|nr:MAG: hypothetical protein A3B66_04495 [Alphaproteobacteria bacterium RIFCSPHIGHO2_02_FULL_46_13]